MDHLVLFKALADGTRLKIVRLLLEHRRCVRALARELELSEAAVSQHLKVLREAGIVIGQRRGYFMHYDADRRTLQDLAREIGDLGAVGRACPPDERSCPNAGARCRSDFSTAGERETKEERQ